MNRFILPLCLGFLGALPAYATPATEPQPLEKDVIKVVVVPAVGTAAADRFYPLFRPFRTEAAALSPDGNRLAYSIREGSALYVVTLEIDNPSRVLSKILVGTTKNSTPFLVSDLREDVPPRIRWMGWATPTRLLVETNANIAATGLGIANTSGAIFGMNADGTNVRTLVSPLDVADFRDRFFNTSFRPDASSLFPTPDLPTDSWHPYHGVPFSGTRTLGTRDNALPNDLSTPRTPTFFDYAPDAPQWIIVRTNSPTDYSLYRVNIDSGKLHYGSIETGYGQITTLLNRQGLIGASIPNTLRTAFPYSYQISKNALVSLGRWNKLNTVAQTDADFTVSPENFFGTRSFPLGFDENPDVLYYASNVGRDTYAVYGLNLKTGERVGKTIESPDTDLATPDPDGFPSPNPLVFDRYTRELVGVRYQSVVRTAAWLRRDLQDTQASLEKTFPGRSVDILEWDRDATRYLALVRGPTEPGCFYVFDRAARKAMEFARRSDLPAESEPLFARYFSLDNPAGGKLTGFVVIPNAVRQKPIPLVIVCANEPWLPASNEFDGEVNALAQMGFAVLQLNPRGTWGFGTHYRQAAGAAFDEAQTADMVTAIDLLAKTLPLNRDRVALLGHKRGGYLALRATQLRPDRFRCVVAVDPTINLSNWLEYTRWTSSDSAPALTRAFFGDKLLRANALMNVAQPITRPAFVASYRGGEGGSPLQSYLDARWFARSVEKSGGSANFWTLSYDYMNAMPGARSDVMRQIEDFLNLNIYSYGVELGGTKTVEK
jgi:dipeptidyl aminopeptidase/acylaminoacyl peptidase